MNAYLRQMTAAFVLPQAMAAEMMARSAELWARALSDAMRTPDPDATGSLPVPVTEAPVPAPLAGPVGPLPA